MPEHLLAQLHRRRERYKPTLSFPAVFENAVSRWHKAAELKGHDGCVNTVEFTPDGRYLISGSDDTQLILWDFALSKAVVEFQSIHVANVSNTAVKEDHH